MFKFRKIGDTDEGFSANLIEKKKWYIKVEHIH